MDVQTSSLFFANAEPQELDLGKLQRPAIGMVEVLPTMAFCTGVLVARDFVLTAAHCNRGDALAFRPSRPDAWPVASAAIIRHPRLDAMLIELQPDFATRSIAPIALWGGPVDDGWVGSRATLAGIGETETGDDGELRFVSEEVVDVSADEITVDGMGRSGACVGDSGGPLLIATEDGRPAVAGILDVGSSNCVETDIYVRADRFAAWVEEVVGARCGVD